MKLNRKRLPNFVKLLTISLSLLGTLFLFNNCSSSGFQAANSGVSNQASLETPIEDANGDGAKKCFIDSISYTQLTYYTKATGTTQAECNSAKITSVCSPATGLFNPALNATRYTSCSVIAAPGNGSAPNVTQITGTVQDNQVVTISGTNFGAKNINQEWLGEFIESLMAGVLFHQQNRPNWILIAPSTNIFPRISSERAWSGTHSLAFDMRGTSEYKQTLVYDTGTSGYKTMYTSSVIYLDHDTLLAGSYLQWKMIRWYKVAGVNDHQDGLSGAYMTQQMRPGTVKNDSLFVVFNSPGLDVFYPDPFPKAKAGWFRYETWLNMNSTPGVANGTFHVRVTNAASGAIFSESTQSGIMFNGPADTGNFRYVILQNYFGNATDPASGGASFQQADNGNAVAFWDDIYISPNTQARAEICSGSTWSNRGRCEVQNTSNWSSNNISVKLNKGGFSSLANTYLYIIDDTGLTNNNGYPLP